MIHSEPVKPLPRAPEDERSLAVALHRGPGEQARPKVLAKGHGALAEQILQIAFDRGVKVRTDADLVELLAAVDVDSEVPLEALAAVAEILSYVYRQTNPNAALADADQPDPARAGSEQASPLAPDVISPERPQ